jgi:hypothetical protein
MKRIICASLLALCLLSSAPAPQSSSAQTAGAAAGGTFRFMDEDGLTRFVDFSATNDREGVTTGGMTYNDPSRIADDDNDGDPPPKPGDAPTEFYIKADFNTMTVEKNRAVMGGTIVDSSHRTYIGRWVQLVVEDNALNTRLSDQLSWQICKPQPGGWVPSDSERKTDDGAYLRWWATDAERKDDVGIPSKNLIPGESKGCEIYPLPAYSFYDLYKWEGDIVVRAG